MSGARRAVIGAALCIITLIGITNVLLLTSWRSSPAPPPLIVVDRESGCTSTTTTSTPPAAVELTGEGTSPTPAAREDHHVNTEQEQPTPDVVPEDTSFTLQPSSLDAAQAAAEVHANAAHPIPLAPMIQALHARVRQQKESLAEQAERYRNDPDAQFDIVYTWVNGSDPELAAARVEYGGPTRATDRDRYNGELLFSMRSLDLYMPWWQGTLFFVHCNLPDWLDVTHPRLKLVHHRDIFQWQHKSLPTFNSDAIESFFYRIPGLSRKFVYMNDDVYITRPAVPSDFFQQGKLVLYFDLAEVYGVQHYALKANAANQFTAKLEHTRVVLLKDYPERERGIRRLTFHNLRHTPHAMSVDILEQLWSRYPSQMRTTAFSRFRSFEAMGTLFMHHHFCLLAAPDNCTALPASVVQPNTRYFRVGGMTGDTLAKFTETVWLDPPLFMCTNDVANQMHAAKYDASLEQRWAYEMVLPMAFPFPSQWEKRR